ncbi:hypothetical protein SteCoe_17419 [Stentor coeruleus]|uniref:Uncharacterized protein n=1 Tax=Stentor coeruleus TaxID=5963 RepID=A0A1R2BZ98_9CILI|nr:hypothetical protein SteCoe_17419 [Stentor coeruleus]
MKVSSQNNLEFVLDKRYQVKIYCIKNIVKASSKDLQGLKKWSGPILGLSINMVLWMAKRSLWAASRFSLNPKTFEVKYLNGLQGGGIGTSSIRSEIMQIKSNHDQNIIEELNENQKKAFELATRISESIKEITIEHNEILKLEKINPYKCTSPYIIAMKLLENFDISEFWNHPQYFDERAVLVSIIRKHLIACFIKNQNTMSMIDMEKMHLTGKFDKVIRIINQNEKIFPELCALVEIKIMRNLIYEASDTEIWLQTILKESEEMLTETLNQKNSDSIPDTIELVDCFDRISNKIKGSFHKYLLLFEIFNIENTDNPQEKTQNLIINELEKIGQLGWKKTQILLNFFENCILQDKVSQEFILKILKTHLQKITQNRKWRIKEKVANVLNLLRGHWNIHISIKAERLYDSMKLDEHDIRVKNILGLPLKKIINPNKNLNEISQKQDDFITNKEYLIDLIIGRENVVKEINKRFQKSNICEITGIKGVGKSSISLKYSEDYRLKYQIIWVIKWDNIKLDLISFAAQLGIYKDKDTLENLKKLLESKKIRKPILLIFDDVEDKIQINNFYTTSENIKYLIVYRNLQLKESIKIEPLSDNQSEDYLKLRLVYQEESEKNIKTLAYRIGGFPLRLKQSIVYINKNKLSIQEYLESIHDLSREETIEKTLNLIVDKMTKEALNALELLSYFKPDNIPEKVIKNIMVENFGITSWIKARSQLIEYYIVIKNTKGKWNTCQEIIDFIRNKHNDSMKNLLIHYYYKNFKADNNVYSEKTQKKKIKELFPHVKNFIKIIEPNCVEQIIIWGNLVKVSLELEFNFEEAGKSIEKIIDKTIEAIKDDNKETIAEIWSLVSNMLITIENYEKSEEICKKCLEIRLQVLQPLHPDLGMIYMIMGNLYQRKSEYSKSEDFYKKCFEIYDKILQPLDPNLAKLYEKMGILYNDKGDYLKSEEFYIKCLKIQEQILSPLHPKLAIYYMNIGNLYSEKIGNMNGEEFYIKCLNIQEQILPPLHSDLADTYNNIGNLYSKKADYVKSEEFYIKCLNIQEQILPPLHPKLAMIFLNIGSLYYKQTEYIKSEEYNMKCLKIYEKILTPLHPDLAIIYMNIGSLYNDKKDYNKSEEYYIKCLKIREQILPLFHPHLAQIYMNLGILYSEKVEYNKSEEYYMKCLKIQEEILPHFHPDLGILYMNIGILYRIKGDYVKSEEFYLKSLKIQEQILTSLHPDLATLYENMGNLYTDKGDFIKREEYNMKCLMIREQILPQLHPDLAIIYMNIGSLYSDKADFIKSEEFFIKCLKIREQILPQLHPDLAILYMNMGNLYGIKGDFIKSEEFFMKSLKIFEKILTPLHPHLAVVYMNLGNLFNEKGDIIKSEDYYIKCLNIQEQILPTTHPDLAVIYMNIGGLYFKKADFMKSEKFYIKCLRIREKYLPPFHQDLAMIYMNMGMLYSEFEEYKKCEEFYVKCLKIFELTLPPYHQNLAMLYLAMARMYRTY